MSYAVTDAVEQDLSKELRVVEELNDAIDQLSSDARGCDSLCPEVRSLLDLVWWFTEEAYREAHGACSCGCSGKSFCQCCHHFSELAPRARRMRAAL